MHLIKNNIESPLKIQIESDYFPGSSTNVSPKDKRWKNKKMALNILLNLITEQPKFKFLQENYRLNYFQGFSDLLFINLSLNHEKYPIKIKYLFLKYILLMIRSLNAENKLKSNSTLDHFFFDVLIKFLYITPEDENIWNNDPDEFIKREDDKSYIKYLFKKIVIEILKNLFKIKDENKNFCYLQKYFNLLFVSYENKNVLSPENILLKESLLFILGNLKKEINLIPSIKNKIQQFFEKQLIFEFKNPLGFLRMRTCWLFGKYNYLEFQNKEFMQITIESIVNCLSDSQIPVRYRATIVLSRILGNEEAKQGIKPLLSKILEIYLRLMQQIDNEEIIMALEGIINAFEENIKVYAVELILQLKNCFQKYAVKDKKVNKYLFEEEKNEENENSNFAAIACLQAIRRLLKNDLGENAYVSSLEILQDVFLFCCSEAGYDYFIDGFSCLIVILHNMNILNKEALKYFSLLIYYIIGSHENFNNKACKIFFADWESEILETVVKCFVEYISKLRENILAEKDEEGNAFIDILFKFISNINSNKYDNVFRMLAINIYTILIENILYPNKMEHQLFLKKILDHIINLYQSEKQFSIQIKYAEVVINLKLSK